jgi:hypothetical protein
MRHLGFTCPNRTFMDKIQFYQCDQLGHYAKDCPLTEHPDTLQDVNISMDQIMCFKCKQLGHFGYMCRAPKARVYERSAATPNTSAQPLKSVSFDPTLPSRPSERSSTTTTSANVQTHTSTVNTLPKPSVYQWSNKNHPWFLKRLGRFQAISHLQKLRVSLLQSRNRNGLWIYSFIVVSRDPSNSYVLGTWSKYFHAQVKIKRHRLGFKITRIRPPPPPKPPIVPPPPSFPFNTNHKAMIGKYGGAIWDLVNRFSFPHLRSKQSHLSCTWTLYQGHSLY